MNILSIKGSLIKKNEVENIESKDGKKWIKQTFLLKTSAEYNNQICFQLFGEEKIKLLEAYQLGDVIEVFFNVSSREYNGRYYHNIDAWKIADGNKEDSTEATNEENLPF
ncbi:MAG: hypothetical protein CMD23_00725 [Flavobacteriales bacterium]|nr:hypothetical protein [Flavobacteriales bacterium]|tara:strand:+ start:834 stop:1163 length:330 start_codon:yes stop_codon:yes gene_type:complete